jgi:hypothetical protein
MLPPRTSPTANVPAVVRARVHGQDAGQSLTRGALGGGILQATPVMEKRDNDAQLVGTRAVFTGDMLRAGELRRDVIAGGIERREKVGS